MNPPRGTYYECAEDLVAIIGKTIVTKYVDSKNSKINLPLIKGAKVAIGANLTVVLWRLRRLTTKPKQN